MLAHIFLVLLIAQAANLGAADSSDDSLQAEGETEEVVVDEATVDEARVETPPTVDEEQLEYARGSVCGYCTYCKFCTLCDKDCPCTKSQKKPNCHMCKYCKYCNLCSAVCDTICTPGGILDRVSGAIVNSLPSFSKDEVDEDIASVQTWIDKKKDEL